MKFGIDRSPGNGFIPIIAVTIFLGEISPPT
jgi:hypothetical protein